MNSAATIELFHGGHQAIALDEINSGGLFCSAHEEAALSHGPVVSRFEIEEHALLTNYVLNYEIEDIDMIRGVLESECADGADIDRAWEIVVESAGCVGAEDELEMFRADDRAEAGGEAQRIRGCVARALGFQAVEMEDEHGTSYLLVGSSH